MPTYEFRCTHGHTFDQLHKISDAPSIATCPVCGAEAVRAISGGAGLVFKGSGFYLTDYGKNAHRTSGTAPAKGGEGNRDTSESKGTEGGGTKEAKDSGGGSAGTGASAGGSTPSGGGNATGGSAAGSSSKSSKSTGGSSGGGTSSGGTSSGGAPPGGSAA